MVRVTVVPVCTVPKSYGEGVAVRIGAAWVFEVSISKSASTACAWLMLIRQAPLPEHAPLQELNTEPVAGAGVSVTVEFWKKLNAHCGSQLMPTGSLVTEPVPCPPTVTFNGCSNPKFAPTDCGEFIVTVHGSMPVQAGEFHPTNPEPAAGFAVNVTWVPPLKLKTQVAPQSIPGGVLVTVPVPFPEAAIVSAYLGDG